MTPELAKVIGNASIATVLAGLLALILFLNHKEKIAAMEDKEGIYLELLSRQTESLENIERTYTGK